MLTRIQTGREDSKLSKMTSATVKFFQVEYTILILVPYLIFIVKLILPILRKKFDVQM